jgi:hypothetical protein
MNKTSVAKDRWKGGKGDGRRVWDLAEWLLREVRQHPEDHKFKFQRWQ